jgi:hypothetical protein
VLLLTQHCKALGKDTAELRSQTRLLLRLLRTAVLLSGGLAAAGSAALLGLLSLPAKVAAMMAAGDTVVE